ncbi:MAG: hypothetical protein II940_01810, partial [Methanosarcinaceae archaeon]|nr:hypothetical protein [Methanosarcinaceae archaeon]
ERSEQILRTYREQSERKHCQKGAYRKRKICERSEQIFEQISERYIYQRVLEKSFFFTAQRTEKKRRSETQKENTEKEY